MFQNLFLRVGAMWEMPVFSVLDGHYPQYMEDYAAFLVTASQHDAFADTDWVVRLRDWLLRSDFCPFAAFYFTGKVLCFQGHPEFTPDYAQALLTFRQKDARGRLSRRNNGIIQGRASGRAHRTLDEGLP